MTAQLTRSMQSALRALAKHGGEGAIGFGGQIIAAGVPLRFPPETWLRLMTLELIEPAGPLRIRITSGGRHAAR
jgi:hypothetical protein